MGAADRNQPGAVTFQTDPLPGDRPDCDPAYACHTCGMAASIAGQTVQVKIKGLAGDALLYAVAEPDPGKAATIVREGIGAAPDDLV